MPQISVIVPVYKVELYLHRCVDSVLGQTFTDFELILVDDGSPDNCGAICDEYAAKDSRIVVIHQKNGGLSAARNAGLDWVFANSDSQWITFIDSDDWVHSNYLQALYAPIIEHGAPMSKCSYIPITSTTSIPECMDFSFEIMEMKDAYLLKNSGVCAPTKLFSRSSWVNHRFPIGKLHEDLFSTYKILFQQNSIAVIKAPLYYYWNEGESITRSNWKPQRLDEFDAFDEQLAFFKDTDYTNIKQKLVGYYMSAIAVQNQSLVDTDISDKKLYEKVMKKRMRTLIFKYFSYAKKEWAYQRWCYNIAFPRVMAIYWRIKALFDRRKVENK